VESLIGALTAFDREGRRITRHAREDGIGNRRIRQGG
jgi:hypothetical protein